MTSGRYRAVRIANHHAAISAQIPRSHCLFPRLKTAAPTAMNSAATRRASGFPPPGIASTTTAAAQPPTASTASLRLARISRSPPFTTATDNGLDSRDDAAPATSRRRRRGFLPGRPHAAVRLGVLHSDGGRVACVSQ